MSMSAAADAFEEALTELGFDDGDLDIGDPRSLGRRAALLAVAGTVWRRHLGPLLTTKQVAELLGVTTRQAVSDRVKRHRILALPAGERELTYPAFQFSANGEPYRAMASVLEVFSTAKLSPHTIASWFVTPQRALDGAAPAEWMAENRGAERLLVAARRAAARTAR